MPPLTYIDKYQIIKPLGSGSFGQVYHVFDRALGAEKAIKVLVNTHPAAFMKSLEEAQILNRCRHKHIVTINEANIFDVNGQRRVVLDLEYIPEGSLETALTSRWVSIKETVTYIRGVLLGLGHAHAQGFLHRDVKPGNILLARSNPKLSDFGLATASGAALIGSAKGYRTHLPTEYYAHPETTVQTDTYAVGITLFRSLSNISDWRAAKMADERTKPPYNQPSAVPAKYNWPTLLKKDGDDLFDHYRHMLESLGNEKGLLGLIFNKSQNKFQDPSKLRRLVVDLIDKENWSVMSADVKGDAYEGLLEKNAQDTKSGAGQYFTPRPLIQAMVDVIQPKPKETLCDPACGTGGFLLAAHDYVVKHNPNMSADEKRKLNARPSRAGSWSRARPGSAP